MSSQTLMVKRCRLPLAFQVNYLKIKFQKTRLQALARLCMQHLIPKLDIASTVVLHTIIDLDVLLEVQIITVVKKKGHFAKGCLSKLTPPQNAVSSRTDSLIASTVGAPACLDCAVMDVVIQDSAARALTDFGVSDGYVNENLAEKINLLKLRTQTKIALVSSTNTAAVSGYFEAKVHTFDQLYHLRHSINIQYYHSMQKPL